MTELERASRDIKWNLLLRVNEKVHAEEFGTMSLVKLQDLLRVSQKLFDELCAIQAAVMAAAKTAADKRQAGDWLMDAETLCTNMRYRIGERVEELEQGRQGHSLPPARLEQPPTMSNPSGLGKFDGTHADWPAFRDLFVALVDSRNYTNLQKLLFLKEACVGAAALAISGYEPLQDCYDTAWEQLKWIYDDDFAVSQGMINRLFNMEPAVTASSAELRRIVDTTTSTLRQLTNLRIKVRYWDPIIINLTMRKLPRTIIASWEQHRKRDHAPNLRDLLNFLDSMARSRVFDEEQQEQKATAVASRNVRPDQRRDTGQNTSRNGRQYAGRDNRPGMSKNTRHTPDQRMTGKERPFFQFAGVRAPCGFCSKGGHDVEKCYMLLSKSTRERRRELINLGLCLNCLGSGHFRYNCQQAGCNSTTCSGDKHHLILCEGQGGAKEPRRTPEDNKPSDRAFKRQRTA